MNEVLSASPIRSPDKYYNLHDFGVNSVPQYLSCRSSP